MHSLKTGYQVGQKIKIEEYFTELLTTIYIFAREKTKSDSVYETLCKQKK